MDAFYVLLGFAMPQTNALIHLYCYLCGFIVALLNKPIKLSDERQRAGHIGDY